MRALITPLEKISAAIYKVQVVVLIIAVAVEVGMNFINVCLRYIVGTSIVFCETLSIFLFMFMVLIGGNIAVKTDSEIKIDLVKFKSQKINAAYKVIVEIIVILALVWLLIGTVAQTISSFEMPSQLIPLPLYTYHQYIVMIIGVALVLLDHFILFLKHISELTGEGSVKEE